MIFKNKIFKLIFSVFTLFFLLSPVTTMATTITERYVNCSWTDTTSCADNFIEAEEEYCLKVEEKPSNINTRINVFTASRTWHCCCRDLGEKGEAAKPPVSRVEPPKFQISLPTIELSTLECHNTDDGGFSCSVPWIAEYITGIYDYGLSIGGILAAIILMAGGVLWLVSGGDASKVSKAKSLIFSSITGLIILFSSYVILYEINPELTKTKNISIDLPGGMEKKYDNTLDDWIWDPGIEKQIGDASSELIDLLNCMRPKLDPKVGRISSISDSNYIGRLVLCNKEYCYRQPTCVHACRSCHYGGGLSGNKSYAVDFGDEENYEEIKKAAKSCDEYTYVLMEDDHVHISTKSCPRK